MELRDIFPKIEGGLEGNGGVATECHPYSYVDSSLTR